MNETTHSEAIATQRYKQASQWLLRLNTENLPENDVGEWLRWCEDANNLAAFERMQSDWQDVVALRQKAPEIAAQHASRLKRHWRVAAAVGALAVLGGIGWYRLPGDRQIVAATTNETQALPDGSMLVLRAQATVKVDFTPRQRLLELAKEGEAYFKVRHDPARPFVVRAGDLTIQAIGTAFDVRYDAERVFVTVEEGSVSISARDRAQWIAKAGDRLEYSQRAGSAVIAAVDAANTLRWRDGEFAYEKVALRDVIVDINRYSTRKITLTDERAAATLYTGTVFVRSLDDWLGALTSKYPVKAVAAPNGNIELEFKLQK